MNPCIITDQISQDFEFALNAISEEGVHRIEIHSLWGKTIEELDDASVEKVKNLMKFYGMSVTCLASTLFMMLPLHDDDVLTYFSPTFKVIKGDLATHMKYLQRAIDIAHKLDCPRIRVFPFRAPENRKMLGDKFDIEAMDILFTPAVRLAERENITLVVENCPYSHLPKGKMTADLVKRIDSPNFKLLYDPANSYRANIVRIPFRYLEGSLVEELRLILPWVDHLHIKDYHYVDGLTKPYLHVPLGKGEVPYAQLLRILHDNGYTGALSCEPEVGFEGTMESLNTLRKLLRTL
ncbi:MAG: sugar phosphate isomerase/epimerase family protein [Erysipelotrichaceae bacterium]